MIDSRKKIILNEILFWKQNKLLPEHYCDFLATLYSEGEDYEEREDLSRNQAILAKEKKRRGFIFSGLLAVTVALLFVLFVVKIWIWLTITFVSVFAVIALISAIKLAKEQSLLAPLIHILAALLILGVSIKVSLTYFQNNAFALYGLLIANSILWLISGIKLKLIYFTISGILALALIIGFSIYYSL